MAILLSPRIKKQSFVIALALAVVMSFLFPSIAGLPRGLGWSGFQTIGVMVIFFLQGLSLPTKELTRGILNGRLHLFIQGWNFLGVVALVYIMGFVLKPLLGPAVWSGFLYLAILPTTVSSAVALTTVAKGDVSGALFNTTLSNILGVFFVPLWCIFFFTTEGKVELDIWPLFVKLSKLILLPLVVGQCLRPFWMRFPLQAKIKPAFKSINNGIIVYIVWVTFSRSVLADTWSQVPGYTIVTVVLVTALVLGLVSFLVWWSAKKVGLVGPARVAAFFCGSQKTLAAGIPMAAAIFAGSGASGSLDPSLLILPLMCYHPLQLFLAGALMGKLEASV